MVAVEEPSPRRGEGKKTKHGEADVDAAGGALDLELVRMGLDALPQLEHGLLELAQRLVPREEVPRGSLLVP